MTLLLICWAAADTGVFNTTAWLETCTLLVHPSRNGSSSTSKNVPLLALTIRSHAERSYVLNVLDTQPPKQTHHPPHLPYEIAPSHPNACLGTGFSLYG